MLINIDLGSVLYIYPITRDLGFAPNPFHGVCTLATCKPKIRSRARLNDWIMGVAGSNIGKNKHECIYLMKVTETLLFDEYWTDSRFELKKPIRNGSKVQVLGDNIYHKDSNGAWIQENSHHSNPDGSINFGNLTRDTGSTERVLISNFFQYFGHESKKIDLKVLGYHRIRDYRKIELDDNDAAKKVITDLFYKKNDLNMVLSDPFHFNLFDKRVDQETGSYS